MWLFAVLDIIGTLTGPANTNQALADRIAGSLMRDLALLEDLQKALTHGEDLVRHTRHLNNQSQTTLRKLQVTQERIILGFSSMLLSWSS